MKGGIYLKIEKLNENKLKITLSIDDLEERNIDLQSFIYNSPESQDLFWDMMQEAEKEYGFDVDESMIYVEASSSGPGMFTLIVTKSDSVLNNQTTAKTKSKTKTIRLKRKNIDIDAQKVLYLFQSFDDVCDFCKTIDIENLFKNTLYELDNEFYLETDSMPFKQILDFASIVKPTDMAIGRLNEYGTIIASDNALQQIGKPLTKKKRIKKT